MGHEKAGARIERRRNFRAAGRGKVIVHGGRGALRGEIVNVSLGGALMRIETSAVPVPARGLRVWLELELGDRWVAQRGRVRRGDIGELAVEFAGVAPEVEDLIGDHVLAAMESAEVPRVVVLDPSAPRRRRVSDALRRAGCASIEASTPLEAITRVETGPHPVAAVAVAERDHTDELVDYFAESNPHIKIAVLADGTGPKRRIPLCDVAAVVGDDADEATLADVLGGALKRR